MCFYVRLSGGQHGFHEILWGEAREAAAELGAVKEVVAKVTGPYPYRSSVFSVSFLNEDDQEVFMWHAIIDAGQVFDPPREVAERYRHDYTI